MRVTVGVVLLIAASSAAAQVYRWTDQSGKTHFTDTPPPASARNAQKRSGGAGAPAAEGSAIEPYALQVARKNFPVKLYTAPGCAACDQARQLLNTRGVPFTEVSVGSAAEIAELKSLVGSASVPALMVGSRVQKGFEEGAYHGALEVAGYPKTGTLRPRTQTEPKQADADVQEKPQETPQETPVVQGPYAPVPPRR